MSTPSPEALPDGTRLRGGAVLVDKLVSASDKALLYKAYDVPSRTEITLYEFCPTGTKRSERSIAPPDGWTAQGFHLACGKWCEAFASPLYSFEENGTRYVAVVNAPVSQHATVLLGTPPQNVPPSPARTVPQPSLPAAAPVTQAVPPQADPLHRPPQSSDEREKPAPARKIQFSWQDVLPDAIRGAMQGAVAGAIGGVVLGALGAMAGGEPVISGVVRGLCGLPIGAMAGAFLAALRALPSSAPQLATASARTTQDQLQGTIAGAGKGALLGLLASVGFFVPLIAVNGSEIALGNLLTAGVLFLLCGAFAGGIVAFIRVAPRDRTRRG